jgi:hypothetical protein
MEKESWGFIAVLQFFDWSQGEEREKHLLKLLVRFMLHKEKKTNQ